MYEKSVMFFITVMVLGSMLGIIALAADTSLPEGPSTLNIENTSRRTAADAFTINASAGNVTQLTLVGNTVTQTWQGFYGNITGTITLDDSVAHTMYDWSLASPQGEIYASNDTVDFSTGNVVCFNYTRPSSPNWITLSTYESVLGLAGDDLDGVNETFRSDLTHDSFYVGGQYINGSVAQGGIPEGEETTGPACPVVRLYNGTGTSDGSIAGQYEEVLLYDENADNVVYTTLIEETEPVGFDGREWDFQMIVGEDGHNGDTALTLYYFYVELE